MPVFLDGKIYILFSYNDLLQENFQQPVRADGEGLTWQCSLFAQHWDSILCFNALGVVLNKK